LSEVNKIFYIDNVDILILIVYFNIIFFIFYY